MPEDPISPILSEYDDLISRLQAQVDLYKTEHDFLRNELIKLLTQNQDLQNLVDVEFQGKLQVNFPVDINPIINSEMVLNLRKQLELSLQERKQLNEMYHASQKQIVVLKEQMSRSSDYVNASRRQIPEISALESKAEGLFLELKMEKSAREDQEGFRIKAQTEAAKLRVLLENQEQVAKQLDEKRRELEIRCKTWDQENAVLRATLDCVSKSRDALETAQSDIEKKIKVLKAQNEEAKIKVEESVDVAERAVLERDSAIQREVMLQTEVTRLSQSIEHVIDEAARRLNAEVKQIQENCNLKLSGFEKELKRKDYELESQDKELKRLNELCKQRESVLEMRKHTDDQVNGLVEEIIELQSRLESNERQLEDAKRDFNNVLDENEKLTLDTEALATRETEFKNMAANLQMQIQRCQCSRLKGKLKNLKATKLQQTTELERQLATQLTLNEKWQKELESLAMLLEEKTQKSAKLSEKLRARNKELASKLKEVRNTLYEIKRKSAISDTP